MNGICWVRGEQEVANVAREVRELLPEAAPGAPRHEAVQQPDQREHLEDARDPVARPRVELLDPRVDAAPKARPEGVVAAPVLAAPGSGSGGANSRTKSAVIHQRSLKGLVDGLAHGEDRVVVERHPHEEDLQPAEQQQDLDAVEECEWLPRGALARRVGGSRTRGCCDFAHVALTVQESTTCLMSSEFCS